MNNNQSLKNKIEELKEIINSSISYQQNTWNKKDEGNWSKLWSAFDNIQDTQSAIEEYKTYEQVGKLATYGILQALIVQQDAVINLEESIDIRPLSLKDYPELKKIRDVRNETIGHPSERKIKRNKPLYKNGEITYTSISAKKDSHVLEYLVWSSTGATKKEVNIIRVIELQEKLLSKEINKVIQKIKQDEVKHIQEFQDDNLVQKLSQSGYLIQKLWPFEHVREYSQTCFETLVSIYEEFKKDIRKRYRIENLNEHGVSLPGLIEVIIKVDKLLPRIEKMIPMDTNVNELDLEVYVESLNNAFLELSEMAIEIDEKFKVQIKQ